MLEGLGSHGGVQEEQDFGELHADFRLRTEGEKGAVLLLRKHGVQRRVKGEMSRLVQSKRAADKMIGTGAHEGTSSFRSPKRTGKLHHRRGP